MKILEKFNAPDNKTLSKIANVLLYIAGPIGTLTIFILKLKKILTPDEAFELTGIWASVVGSFKLLTKFSTEAPTTSAQREEGAGC